MAAYGPLQRNIYNKEEIEHYDYNPKKAKEILDELIVQHPDTEAIGLTGQMHGMLYVDETGRAVSPLYTWQDRGGDQIWKDGLTYAQFLKASAGDAASGYGLTTHYYLQQTGKNSKRQSAKMTTYQ